MAMPQPCSAVCSGYPLLLPRVTELAQGRSGADQEHAADGHQRQVEPREGEPSGRLHGLRAQRLLDRALHADVRVALDRRILQGGLQVRLRVRMVETPVVGVVTVDLL